MFETFRNAWKITDLRKKILYTLMIILIFRIGAAVPVPFVNAKEGINIGSSDSIINYLSILSGDALKYATLFAMSITPYINASIIMELLTVAIPALGRLAKEGEEGRKKIASITRYAAVGLGLIQSTAYYIFLRQSEGYLHYKSGFPGIFTAIVIILSFTAGTALIMWLGEQINEKGIGNGISIILFAGIVSRGPMAFMTLWQYFYTDGIKTNNMTNIILIPFIVVLFLCVIGFIVWMDNAERRIPIQYAKRVVGRKVYGGQSTHMPIKVNLSGVLPIIFASSILSLPATIQMFVKIKSGGFWEGFFNFFKSNNWGYALAYFLLIIMFAFFYATIQYNPIEMANNLRKNSGAIPGIRPGRPTADYIHRILNRITLLGAIFLSVIAILPIMISIFAKVNISLGGTSVLILVGVALETVRQIESQMMMRHYKGFLE